MDNLILSVIEVFLQMSVGIILFTCVHDRKGRARKVWSCLMLGLCFILEGYNNIFNQISLSAVPLFIILESFGLWIWAGRKWRAALYWCLLYKNFFILCKIPALVLAGIYTGNGLEKLIREKNVLMRIYGCVVIAFIYLVIKRYFEGIKNLLVIIFDKYLSLLLTAGILEYLICLGVWNLGVNGFSVQIFLLTILLILCQVFLIFFWIVMLLYKMTENKLNMMCVKEKIIKQNFKLIMQEQDKIRKINHDRKYDFLCLLDCLENREYEKGKAYIIEKFEQFKQEQAVKIWTGCSGIDYLLNSAVIQAREKCIDLKLETGIIECPIKEYDFFVILGNLLDNALDAAAECIEGRKFAELKLYRINNITVLLLKNSYLTEPIEKRGKLLSTKGGREHGWGIENIKEILERNDGVMDISYGGGIFTVQVTFGLGR